MKRPNWPLAFILAPLAGGLAVFVLGFPLDLFIDERRAALLDAAYTAIWALVISAVYTAVLGMVVVIFVRVSGRTLPLAVALIVGVLTGFLPFAVLVGIDGRRGDDAIFFALLALVASLATAWTFWTVGLKGRGAG